MRTVKPMFVHLPEVNSISEFGTGSVARSYIHFSAFFWSFFMLVAIYEVVLIYREYLVFLDAILDLKSCSSSSSIIFGNRKSGRVLTEQHVNKTKPRVFYGAASLLNSGN